ncbi:MAG: ATP-binding protein [Dysgonamonadaceae bacterium]
MKKIQLSYKKRILFLFSLIIALFTLGIIFFEHYQVRKERTKSMEMILDNYAETVHHFIEKNNLISNNSLIRTEEVIQFFPDTVRITIVDQNGIVLYDNRVDAKLMDNHLKRTEIQKAIYNNSGSNIRLSTSTNSKYQYYAKKYNDYFIRVALPYNMELNAFLNSGNSFVYFIILFFFICVLLMFYFANQFSKSIQGLKEFSMGLKSGQNVSLPTSFVMDNEVHAISSDIIDNYKLLQDNRKKLTIERERLLQHFQYSEEGIVIFTAEGVKIYANSHFLQYLNVIVDKPTLEVESILKDINFVDFIDFWKYHKVDENVYLRRIEKNGKQFNVRMIVFDDNSFEINITDITKQEKTRLLKQEMTNNIAHELRTPVASIRGYLETVQNLKKDDDVRRNSFLDRAYIQTIRLSELIQDISMLTKIEEASDQFTIEAVNIKQLLEDLYSDLEEKFKIHNDRITIDVDESIIIEGSRSLLYSIFRNLIENALAYAGEDIEIGVRCYIETNEAIYFDVYDNGIGIEEKHLVRIFERFYRINEGRTRITGGSGLGLSIVKNAVLFHNGSIVARNRPEGGLSFLITFPKAGKKPSILDTFDN